MQSINIEDILPHRGTMLLLEKVTEVGDEYAVAEAVVRDSWPAVDNHGASPLVLVELAAQTAGVCNSLKRIKKEGNETSRKGWIVGVKRAQFYVDDVIAFGSRLVIRSENSHEYDILREVSCVVHCDDMLLGEITLQLIQA